MTIQELCVKYGSDKTPEHAHSYAPKYDELLSKKRGVKTVLEIGIGYPELMTKYANWNKPNPPVVYTTGASLYVWRDYFKGAMIYGVDIEERAMIEGEERIKTVHQDVNAVDSLLNLIKEIQPLDIVVDDGSHILKDQINTAKLLLPYMKKGGFYFIEDIDEPEKIMEEFKDKNIEFFDWRSEDHTNDCLILIRC